MKKKVMSLTLALLMLLSLCTSAMAATPRWITTDSCDVSLSFSGTTAVCGAGVYGSTGVNKIVAKVSLEKKNSNGTYSGVTNWEETVYSRNYMLDATSRNCVSGATYRLTITATVYNSNGKSETVSNSIIKTC